MNEIIKDMDINEYHSNKLVLSASSLKYIKKSTRAFIHYATTEQEKKLHFDFGNAFELYLVDQINGTNEFADKVAIKPTAEWKAQILAAKPNIKSPALTAEYKDIQADFVAKNANKYIIDDIGPTESMEALKAMADNCMKDPVVKAMLYNSDYQESFFWTDPETGVKMKTRPDLSVKKKKIIFDIKTCKDASPKGFTSQLANFDYPIQAICQIEGAIHTGYFDKCEGYFWLAVEKEPPYDWCIYELQQQDIEDYYTQYHYLLRKGARAIQELRQWLEDPEHFVKSYGENADNPHGIVSIEIPLWYRHSF
jgi:hypothetical protein